MECRLPLRLVGMNGTRASIERGRGLTLKRNQLSGPNWLKLAGKTLTAGSLGSELLTKMHVCTRCYCDGGRYVRAPGTNQHKTICFH